MKKPSKTSGTQLDQLVASLGMEELSAVSADELCRVEGGRARLATSLGDNILNVNQDDVRLDINPY